MRAQSTTRWPPLVGIALIVGLFQACSAPENEEGADVEPLVAVRVARAEIREVTLTVSAPASIHPRAVAQIAARVTAPISSLRVGKGDRVAEGQVVATLENRDLLAQIDDAEAALRQAQETYQRRRDLFAEGAVPERDLLASKAELERAEARNELIRVQLAFTELTSPFAGIVTDQFLYPGDMAKPDAPIFTVMDVSVVVARAQVSETDVATVRVGQAAVFVPADPRDALPEGRISVVSAAADPARRTVEVWCEIPNRDGLLHPGAFGSLQIQIATMPDSVVVPDAAVELEEGSRSGTVLVVDDGNIAHRRHVECGESFDGLVQVKGGLESGETVVVEGGYGLPDATHVTLIGNEAR